MSISYHRRLSSLLSLSIVVAALLASPDNFRALNAASPAAPDPNSPFGVAGVMRWPDWGSFDRPADAFLQTGGSWVREDFVWGLIEPQQGRMQWTATDRIVAALQQRNLNVLGIVSYSVNWATPATQDDNAPSPISFYPPDGSKYYWFVRTLVTRYKSAVHYWEIWNEPNSPTFWKPQPDAGQYASLLITAYKAIKDADPTAKVLTAGMSGNAVPFLEQVLASGAANSFDILAIHPYAIPLDPQQARAQSQPDVHKIVEVELSKYRAFLQRHSLNRPMWITEIGWPASDWQLDPDRQANYLAQAYAQILASRMAERVFWYSFKDEGPTPDKSWGLIGWGNGSTDLAPHRPAFATYTTAARMLTGTTPKGTVQTGNYASIGNFDTPAAWVRTVDPSGDFEITTDQHHAGTASARLTYRFDTPNQAVDFAPPQPLQLPGKPNSIGVWVLGDASGNYLSAWLRDRDGELFKVRLGAVTGPTDGWRYYEARLNGYFFDWEHSEGSPANGVIDYPVSFVAFRLENTPDEPAGSGTIYIDDLVSREGQDATVERFARPDGQVVDVVWSNAGAQLSLPTRSKSAQVVDRDGNSHTIEAANGALTVQAGPAPLYLVHIPVEQPDQTYTGPMPTGSIITSPACQAQARVAPLASPDSRFFAETGHNIQGTFKAYWETHDGLRLLGYPISEEFFAPSTDGKEYRQQYFQRARMEYHPENAPPNDILLGLLGAWATGARNFQRGAPTEGAGARFFPETGHSLRLFRSWWSQNGGLPVFGYPISDELQEKNAADGQVYTVQYFERNRLEYHPEYKGTPNEVLLGLLGVEYMSKQGCR